MGYQDSYRETFALWVGNTLVSGSDHSGKLGLAGEAKLAAIHYGRSGECLRVCKHGCKKVKGIYITKKSVDWPGLSIRHSSGNANGNFLHLSQLERGRDVS